MLESVGAGLVALWILSRSNLSTSRTLTFEINNPFDQKTKGYIDTENNNTPVQPTYGKINAKFPLPEIEKCKAFGKTKDGKRRYFTYYVADSPQRVNITVPSGAKGAGEVFNRSNLVSPNMGAGYYTIIQHLDRKVVRPSSYRYIGLPNYLYETAQRYVVYQDKQTAIDAAQAIFDNYNASVPDDDDPTPSPPSSPPTFPEAPPSTPPQLPPQLPPQGLPPQGLPDLGGMPDLGSPTLTQIDEESDNELIEVNIPDDERLAIDVQTINTQAIGFDQRVALNGGSTDPLMRY